MFSIIYRSIHIAFGYEFPENIRLCSGRAQPNEAICFIRSYIPGNYKLTSLRLIVYPSRISGIRHNDGFTHSRVTFRIHFKQLVLVFGIRCNRFTSFCKYRYKGFVIHFRTAESRNNFFPIKRFAILILVHAHQRSGR